MHVARLDHADLERFHDVRAPRNIYRAIHLWFSIWRRPVAVALRPRARVRTKLTQVQL